MKVEIGKKYKTRSGAEVSILAVDLDNGEYTVVVFMKGSGVYAYTSEGKFSISCSPHPKDLVEVCEWDDFKIDDKVMVRNAPAGVWFRKHFAGADELNGKPTTYTGGRSSHTEARGNLAEVWDECRKPTEEELK